MLTIREQILQLAHTQLLTLTQANGYHTDVGLRVIRGRNDITPGELPCTFLYAYGDTDPVKSYSFTTFKFDIGIVSVMRFLTHNPSTESEKILGDHIACLASPRLAINFINGHHEPRVGQYLTGLTSSATGVLESTTLSGNSWAAHSAYGTFQLRLPKGYFTLENLLNSGGERIADTTGDITLIPPFNSLIDDIDYTSSTPTNYPDPGEEVIKVSSAFTITYTTLTGNPYEQGE